MLTPEVPEQLQFLQLQQQHQQTHPAPQMFDAFHQSPHGEFKPTFYNPFEVKHRRRTSRQQLKVLEKAFNENPKPHAAVRHALAQKLSMSPRGVQVWFQNRRAKAKKQKPDGISADGDDDDASEKDSNDALSTISSPNADDSLESYYCGATSSTTVSPITPNSPTTPSTVPPDSPNSPNSPTSFEINNSAVDNNNNDHVVNHTNLTNLANLATDQSINQSNINSNNGNNNNVQTNHQIFANFPQSVNDQSTKKSRPKPNIDPLKTSWQTQEEYDLMVQRRQFEQFGQKYNNNHNNNDWIHSNLSSATTVGSDYLYDHILPLSNPASAVTISDCFTEYAYSPVSSVISDNKDGNSSIASSNDSLNPAGYARRNSCPELMASILNMKLGSPDEKRPLSTIIEDEALSNDPVMHQFLGVPTQFKRRFSEPINSPTTNTADNTTATTIPQNHASFPFNLHTILTNQQNDHHPLLRNNNVWPSATTTNNHHHNLKEWNFQLDYKQQKLPINSTVGLKNADATTINVTHWNTLPSSNVNNSTINSNMTIPMTDDMSFMHYYETSNDQVVG